MGKFARYCAALGAALLVACGGGGGGGNGNAGGEQPPAGTSPTGFWKGSTTTGLTASMAVFPDGSVWEVHAGPNRLGLVQGTINGQGREFSVLPVPDRHDGTITTAAITKQSITSQLPSFDHGLTFNGTYAATFEQAPSLAAAAGTFVGTGASAGSTVTIGTNGAITGGDAGCTFTGTATPRTDGNAFNVSIAFGAQPCALPGQTLSGIAVYDSAERALISAVINSAREYAAIFIGAKQ